MNNCITIYVFIRITISWHYNIIDIFSVSNERLCYELIYSYQNDGIILEPAGGLSLCGLEQLSKLYKYNNKSLKDKNIVCILSGGNNDITRYGEIMELNLKYLDL